MTHTHGSLFTGIGGFELGLGAAGFETLWSSEIEKYCNRVLAEKLPEVPNLGDVTQVKNPAAVDVLSFGSPCQDLSVAGRRAGLEGSRSGLFFEAARVIDECKPAFAVWENVPGSFTSQAGRDFWAVLDTLVQLGCRSLAWRVFDSQYAGVPQQRRRVYLVADFRGERAGEVLFDPQGCSGHPSPFGATGEGVAGTLAAGAHGAGRPGGSHDTDLVVAPTLRSGPPPGGPGHGKINGSDRGPFVVETSAALTSKWAKGSGGPAGDETQNLVPAQYTVANRRGGYGWSQRDDGVSPTLQSQGGSHQGGSDVTPYLIQDARNGVGAKGQNGEGVRRSDVAYTLDTLNTQAVAFLPRHFTRGKDGAPSELVPALTADSDRGDGQAVVFDPQQVTSKTNRSQDLEGASYSLNAKGTMSVARGPMIRRFTPLECERLQAFPDGWTCLCGVDWRDNPAQAMFDCRCPDGPRYRALGNAVTCTVPWWIGTRIQEVWDHV